MGLLEQPVAVGRTIAIARLVLLGIAWVSGAIGAPAVTGVAAGANRASPFLSASALGGEAAWSVSQSFRYDRLGRLTTFQEKPGSTTTDVETSAYDQWGNRFVTQGATPGMGIPTAATAFDALNRMGSGYDDSGNLTSYSPVTLTYDAENRIVKAELVFNGTVTETTTYEYDGAGRRVKKTFTPASGSAVTTTFVYDAGGELAAEYGGPSSTMSGVRYVLSDHMGTTRALIASDGSVDKRYDFKPFGEEIGSGVRGRSAKYSSPSYPGVGDGFNQKFTGKERDAETGLDYFGARYLSAAQGRFTSPDEWAGGIVDPFTGQQVGKPGPLPYADITDPQTINKYAYVRNNPLRYTDPDGHVIDTLADIGFIAYDIYDIAKNGASTTSVLALGADVVGAVVPFATGLGAGVRAAHAVEGGVHAAEAGMHLAEGGAHAAEAGRVAKAETAGGDKLLYRRGANDSEKVLKTQAQAAESAGLPHGVSVSTSSAAKPGQVVRCATCSSVEAAGFKVHKTGSDPNHHTVELPKPITKKIAEKWNDLFQ